MDNDRESVSLVLIVRIACGKKEAVVSAAAIYPIISGDGVIVFGFEW
jgi:hypothetical protein